MNIEGREYDDLELAIKDSYKMASRYASEGVKNGIGGPFGAAIINKQDGKYIIIAVARNTVIETNDITNHAEINAIRIASKLLGQKFLNNCILVTTARSCPMCLSAAIWAQIKTIYYSEDYEVAASNGFKDAVISEYIQGSNKTVIKEVNVKDGSTIEPFEEWGRKLDRVDY